MEKKLMNRFTGSVDTEESWRGDYESAVKAGETRETWEEWSKCLVEIEALEDAVDSVGGRGSESRGERR